MKLTLSLTFVVLLFVVPAARAQFVYTTNSGTITITGYTGPGGDVTIPDTINGLPVASIGDFALYSCTSLVRIAIPNSVIRIGSSAFEGCTGVTNVALGKSVTSIGSRAFGGCGYLTTITIPASVTSIQPEAFAMCLSLRSVYFEGDAPTFGAKVFFQYEQLGGGVFDPVTLYYLIPFSGWSTVDFYGVPTAVWQPRIQPASSMFGINSNQFGFTVNWATGMTVVVEACTSVSGGNWIPLQTNTLTSGSCYFSDPAWINHPARFYRIKPL
jgi:hypothetical protein